MQLIKAGLHGSPQDDVWFYRSRCCNQLNRLERPWSEARSVLNYMANRGSSDWAQMCVSL